jgi:hypothetical protein
VVIWGINQRIGNSPIVLNHVIKANVRAYTQQSGYHRTGQIGIHEQGAIRVTGKSTRESQHECGSALSAMTARKEYDLEIPTLSRLEQELRHSLEAVAALPLKCEYRRRPLEFARRVRRRRGWRGYDTLDCPLRSNPVRRRWNNLG